VKGYGERVTRGVGVAVGTFVGGGMVGPGVGVTVGVKLGGGVGVTVGVAVGVHVDAGASVGMGVAVVVATKTISGSGGKGLKGKYGLMAIEMKHKSVMTVSPNITKLNRLKIRSRFPMVPS